MIDISSPNYPQDEPNNNVNRNFPIYRPSNWSFLLPRSAENNMQEIIPGLFLGSCSSAEKHCLLDNNISYIICVRQELEAHFIKPQFNDPKFTYLTLNIEDNVTENIIRFFPKVKQFIDEGISRNCKVLVHGNSGNSRSAALVLAYVMEKFSLSSEEAYRFVKNKRASISPNEGFVAQLHEYEPIYKARQSLNQGESSSENFRQKRKSERLAEPLENGLVQPPPSPNSENNNEDSYQNVQDFSNSLYRLLMKH